MDYKKFTHTQDSEKGLNFFSEKLLSVYTFYRERKQLFVYFWNPV